MNSEMSTSKMRHVNKGWMVCHQLLIGIDLYEFKWVRICILNHPADCCIYCHSKSLFISVYQLPTQVKPDTLFELLSVIFLQLHFHCFQFFLPSKSNIIPILTTASARSQIIFISAGPLQFKLMPSYISLSFTRCLSPSYLGYVNSLCICLTLNHTCDQMLKHQSRLQPNNGLPLQCSPCYSFQVRNKLYIEMAAVSPRIEQQRDVRVWQRGKDWWSCSIFVPFPKGRGKDRDGGGAGSWKEADREV